MSNEVEVDESPSIAALAAALAKAQGAMRAAKKDSFNPHFKSKYADLASVIDAARDQLAANGLALIQPVTNSSTGVIITTRLMHASGEWIRSRLEIPVSQNTAQGIGSAITYGKRFAMSAMLCIAADDDDDGNAASARPYTPPTAAPKPAATNEVERALHEIAAAETAAELRRLGAKIKSISSAAETWNPVRQAFTIRSRELAASASEAK